jgi:hypothetical protein
MTSSTFTCVRVEGPVLPIDLLQRVAAGDERLDGLRAEDYGLVVEKVNEVVNHAWTRLSVVWEAFKAARDTLPDTDSGYKLTVERWLVPLWKVLGYGTLDKVLPFVIDGKTYPVSHFRYHCPVHFVGYRQDLDRRIETDGKQFSPHGLVQEFLNRSDAHLWGFVSNGLKLRILRDNIRLTRQAFVEFDLLSMFDGKQYADFALLWRLCHESRINTEKPENCWLERWSRVAAEQGLRALDQLRTGVENAVKTLGRGFLACTANADLKAALKHNWLTPQEYYRQLLRVVYRFLFLFVAEDREQLLDPAAADTAKDRYARFYSATRLRRMAELLRGGPHTDLYEGLSLVLDKLGTSGCPDLALPPLGGLFDPFRTPDLAGCRLVNTDLLEAIRALAVISDGQARRSVDYRNLGAEELGSVYESLLELQPRFDQNAITFTLESASGNERKTTGSYYTPTSLITCLLDSALDPVLNEAAKKPDSDAVILNLKVCDPACGSGHFLIAAAYRIAKKLAAVRTFEEEPAPDAVRHALRDVIGRCIFGVDINPMAVELCQVALWMEALEPGKPLSFLDHHVRCGNSLLGATPALLEMGIPDDAFKPIEGDDKKWCSALKRQNKDERRGQGDMFAGPAPLEQRSEMVRKADRIESIPDDTIEAVHEKERLNAELRSEDLYRRSEGFLSDLWCAAFVAKKTKDSSFPPITEKLFRKISDRVQYRAGDVHPDGYTEVRRLAQQYQFLHWHLAFPSVFRYPAAGEPPDNALTGWCGGFDVILGNPPWERIKLQEQEWFATHSRPDIAGAKTAAIRGRLIRELQASEPALFQAFIDDRRKAEGESHLVRDSSANEASGERRGMYPLCGRGDVNTYSLFAELNRNLIRPTGRVGCIVPAGIATDDTTKLFFQDLVTTQTLVNLFGFENEEFIFPGVHHATKFCLLTIAGSGSDRGEANFVFFARQAEHLIEVERLFTLSPSDFRLLNPNTRTCPVFRTARDAILTKAIHRRVPVLIRDQPEDNSWGIRFLAMFHMSNDSDVFRTAKDLHGEGWDLIGNVFHKAGVRQVPLYEAKMMHQFDHRWGSYEGQTDAQANQAKLPELTSEQHADPHHLALPRHWVSAEAVDDRLKDRWDRDWLLGWRDITRNTDTRTTIASVLPRVGVGHTSPLMMPKAEPDQIACLYANLCSFVFDYVLDTGEK